MGLQNQLSDISSESTIILLAVLIAKTLSYLRSFLFAILHALGLFSPRFGSDHHHHLYDVVGSGLAGVILLCEQLNLNRLHSRTNRSDDGVDRFGSDCVVCLNRFGDGDNVRKLACRHAFHKDCFDAWLQHLNFDCPLCRAPLVSDERVDYTRRRVAENLLASVPFQ